MLLGRVFAGKDTINVLVREEGGEKKLYFDAVNAGQSELVFAGK